MKISAPVTTPTLDKMLAVREQSQAIGEFIEWLTGERRLVIAAFHRHTGACNGPEPCMSQRLAPALVNVEELLAEFFEIDLDAMEREKRAVLASLAAPSTVGRAP